MEELNFAALAPRYGTRPLMVGWSDIGTSQLNGGALNWGSIWSGLKNFGSSIKSLGQRAWNSNAGQQLRNKLNDTKLQDKIVEGISTGIHGAVDLANQEINKAIQKKLDQRPTVEVLENSSIASAPAEELIKPSTMIVDLPPKSSSSIEKINSNGKRPAEEIIITTDEPPSYDELYPSKSSNVIPTRPVQAIALAKPAPVPKPSVSTPSINYNIPKTNQTRGWQGTLNNIVGLGVRSVKKRRCY